MARSDELTKLTEDWAAKRIEELEAEIKPLRELAEMVRRHAEFGIWPESVKSLDIKANEYFAMVKK